MKILTIVVKLDSVKLLVPKRGSRYAGRVPWLDAVLARLHHMSLGCKLGRIRRDSPIHREISLTDGTQWAVKLERLPCASFLVQVTGMCTLGF